MTPYFLWGSATSSHQIEGNNTHNDWWAWEQLGRVKTSSGKACDHYHRYQEDLEIIASLGHNAYRFSIEWSRLEPEENQWSSAGFAFYESILKNLRSKNIEPIVTLHHFTNPAWFAEKGGWENPEAAKYFLRFLDRVLEAFSSYVNYWITFNEPLIYIYFSYMDGKWPPGKKSISDATQVLYRLIQTHVQAYIKIHDFYDQRLKTQVWVSIAKHVSWFTPARKHHWLDRLSTWFRHWFFNEMLVDALHRGFLFFPGIFCEPLPRAQTLDFIGVNYYTRDFIRFGGLNFPGLLGESDEKSKHQDQISELNQMGWEVYPEGLYLILGRLKRFQLPIIITENGICALHDEQRERFIRSHMSAVLKARHEGADIRGFFYWSLVDNFEWADGFDPRFGLVEVDYQTFQRKVRNSAQIFSELCRNIVQENI